MRYTPKEKMKSLIIKAEENLKNINELFDKVFKSLDTPETKNKPEKNKVVKAKKSKK